MENKEKKESDGICDMIKRQLERHKDELERGEVVKGKWKKEKKRKRKVTKRMNIEKKK